MNELDGEEGNRLAFVAELDRRHALMVAAGERLAFQMEEAIRLELALAFTLDRPTRPIVLASPTGGIVRVELAPEDQARLYL